MSPTWQNQNCGAEQEYYFIGSRDKHQIIGYILILAKVIKNVVASTSEVEIVALFIHSRINLPLQLVIKEMIYKRSVVELIKENITTKK